MTWGFDLIQRSAVVVSDLSAVLDEDQALLDRLAISREFRFTLLACCVSDADRIGTSCTHYFVKRFLDHWLVEVWRILVLLQDALSLL